jgi:hypothetical protein
MARWKPTAKHYFHARQFGQPTEWQREEVNVQTGRAFRKSYVVPMFIDPDDPWCINRHLGYCVLATEGCAQPGDIEIFNFKPTPDMEPLDDEARALSEAERPNWINPIDGLSPQMGEDFAQQLLGALQQRANSIQFVPSAGVQPSAEFSELKGLVAAQQRQIETLILALSGKAAPTEGRSPTPNHAQPVDIESYDPSNHVKDDLEPLPSIEEVEAAQRAAAGLTKPTVKITHPMRRI